MANSPRPEWQRRLPMTQYQRQDEWLRDTLLFLGSIDNHSPDALYIAPRYDCELLRLLLHSTHLSGASLAGEAKAVEGGRGQGQGDVTFCKLI